MKHFFSLAAVISLVLADPGFVQLPVSVKKGNATHGLKARSADFPVTISNQLTGYYVELELGTPGQVQQVHIDTGSSDLWVYGPKSPGANQIYDPSQSSTSKYINDGFDVSYIDGSSAKGDYYTDDVSVDGVSVNVQFAVVNQKVSGDGVFGIATAANVMDDDGTYANYPVALKQHGITESSAYSLYLNDLHADSGTLLFGGVDTSKYSGPLYTIPVTSKDHFFVDVEVDGHRMNVDLDAGASFTYLDDDVANALAAKVNGKWDDDQGVFFVDKATDISVTFNFSGAEITVPSSELFAEWQGGLAFLIGRASYYQGNMSLGDSFLRSAYVVYDADNSQVAIAQADYNGSGSVQAITSAGIPGAKQAPGF